MRINIIVLIIAGAIWLIAEICLILRDKTHAKGSTKADRMSRMFNSVTIALALCSPWISLLLPTLQFDRNEIPILTLIGTLLICLGFALRYWSISILGRYFRTTVEIEEGHKVIKKGPYKYIRHPCYSGIILFSIGYGLVSQNWFSFAVSLLLPAAALVYRISVEEEEMVRGIGPEYINYQSETKKLIPGIW